MSVAVATDTFATKVAEPNRRLTAAEMADYTRPRAMLSADPTVRLIGGMLLSHGGTWTGTTTELFEGLVEETGDRGAVGNTLAANAAAFGKRFVAMQRDLYAVGVAVSNVRRKVGGFDRRRWVITATDCHRAMRNAEFDAFAEEMLESDELDIQTAATNIRGSYLHWRNTLHRDDKIARADIPRQTFFRLLRNEAARRGAIHAVIDDVVIYKGLRLKRFPPKVLAVATKTAAADPETGTLAVVTAVDVTAATDIDDEVARVLAATKTAPADPETGALAVVTAVDVTAATDIDDEVARALAEERAIAEAGAASARRWFALIAVVCLFAAVWYAVA